MQPHIHIKLPKSGAVANVSPGVKQEVLEILDELALKAAAHFEKPDPNNPQSKISNQ